jgi:cyanate lyase
VPAAVAAALEEFPHKQWDKLVPTDPVIYRFYELINVYGPTLKELIHEEFGDGIMSATDFDMIVRRVKHEKGDRE